MTGTFTSVISGPDRIEVEILDTIQAPKWKGDGQILVTVYSGRYREDEVILKVILMAGFEDGSPRARTEIAALQRLTERGCKHSPRLLASWVHKPESALRLVEHYIVMTKLKGTSIPAALQQGNDASRIAKAFKEAIEDVHSCGVDNGAHGHHQGNALYDASKNKCYIIDFDKGMLYDNPDQIDPAFRDIKTWFHDWHEGWDGYPVGNGSRLGSDTDATASQSHRRKQCHGKHVG